MTGETNLNKLIESMTPSLADDRYVFVSQPACDFALLAKLQPLMLFQEQEGSTLILTQAQADSMQFKYESVFACITLNVHSSLDAVGLTAAVASALARENISANVVAAYYHDHIFIADKDAEKALATLIALAEKGLS